jgi:APA family basic amino acid/polyamine antiporter
MPYLAILVQGAWAIFLVLVSSFKEIIQYISVSLSIFSMITVIGIFWLRKQHPQADSFKVPLYPITPLIFVGCTVWMIYYVADDDPKILIYSLATLIPGYILYLFANRYNRKHNKV